MLIKRPSIQCAALTLAVFGPLGAAHAGTTSINVGLDVASGDYGTAETTSTYTAPVSLKHENGPWTLRASLPLVHAEGTFSRDQGFDDSGRLDKNGRLRGSRGETGIGDLTVAAHYTLIDNPDGLSLDLGGKAKIATADEDKTLLSSGENDYSVQADVFRALPRVAVFATLGYTVKGEPAGVSYRNPFYGALGLSLPLAAGRSVGAAWDYRQKVVGGGAPVSELSAFYSQRFDPRHKIQLYAVYGLADGSPEFGGGVVLSRAY